MNPVAKALWFIESHLDGEISLAEVAEVAGVSRFHLVRAFGDTTGFSVMRYVRARRLTQAAEALAGSNSADVTRVFNWMSRRRSKRSATWLIYRRISGWVP